MASLAQLFRIATPPASPVPARSPPPTVTHSAKRTAAEALPVAVTPAAKRAPARSPPPTVTDDDIEDLFREIDEELRDVPNFPDWLKGATRALPPRGSDFPDVTREEFSAVVPAALGVDHEAPRAALARIIGLLKSAYGDSAAPETGFHLPPGYGLDAIVVLMAKFLLIPGREISAAAQAGGLPTSAVKTVERAYGQALKLAYGHRLPSGVSLGNIVAAWQAYFRPGLRAPREHWDKMADLNLAATVGFVGFSTAVDHGEISVLC